uniref:NADH dehydrogenase subunit 6 n=1 Tax=Balta maculata TaxID=3037036 RepID=UPI0027A15CE1|nr:NADH dehydrogenase subunit 6 [Balta maculata]WGO57142.1 NADH dehydrogenase subunit 6 [Balta maculata]
MEMILLTMATTSFMFTQMKHPMTMGFMLLLQTMMTSIITGMMSQTFWFSYVLMLVFLGGMMVLFIYVTSVASNEMILLSMKMIMMFMITMLIMTLYKISYHTELTNQETITMTAKMNSPNNLMKLYNSMNSITIMMATYLFISLITIVKITNIFKGPLRKMN